MNSRMMYQLTIFALFAFISVKAEAQSYGAARSARPIERTYGYVGALADVSLYYSESKATATPAAGNSWDHETSVYDVKLGYIMESQFYVGGIYSVGSDNQATGSAAKASRYTGGAGVGYFTDNGFNFRAYYLFSSKYGDYTDGIGYQIDAGYAVNPTSSFFLGLALSLRDVTYKTNPTIAGFDSWSRKETYPFVTFGFLFN